MCLKNALRGKMQIIVSTDRYPVLLLMLPRMVLLKIRFPRALCSVSPISIGMTMLLGQCFTPSSISPLVPFLLAEYSLFRFLYRTV